MPGVLWHLAQSTGTSAGSSSFQWLKASASVSACGELTHSSSCGTGSTTGSGQGGAVGAAGQSGQAAAVGQGLAGSAVAAGAGAWLEQAANARANNSSKSPISKYFDLIAISSQVFLAMQL
jgi:hypothetical protein